MVVYCLIAVAIAGMMNFFTQNAENQSNTLQLQLVDSLFGEENVHIYGAEIDGSFVSAQNIFGDSLTYEEDGSLVLTKENMGEQGISGVLPYGTKQELIFERANYCGDVVCNYQGASYHISTYGRYWEKMNFTIAHDQVALAIVLAIIPVAGCLLFIAYILIDRKILYSLPVRWEAKHAIFLLSGCMLTVVLAANSQLWWIIAASVAIGFPIYVYLQFKPSQFTDDKAKIFIVAVPTTICVFGGLVLGTVSALTCLFASLGDAAIWSACVVYFMTIPSVFCLICKGCIECGKYWAQWRASIDDFEKKYLWISVLTLSVLIYLVHTHTSAFSTGTYQMNGMVTRRYADVIYGYDHSWLLDASSTWSTNDFNIRHPFLKILTIAQYSILHIIASIVEPLFSGSYGLILSLFNMLAMVGSAILLRRITRINWIAPIYSLTYFFIIMCLGMEQYQISVFFLCLTIYYVTKQDEKHMVQSAIWMSGATLTSGHLIPLLYSDQSWKQRWKKMLLYCVVFLGVSGAAGVIPAALIQSKDIMTFVTDIALIDRLKVFTNFATWQFFSPKAVDIIATDGAHLFTAYVPEYVNILGVLILLACGAAVIVLWKDRLCRICGWSILFSFVLCAGLGWAINEAWLYAILFSWAYICLIVKLIDKIVPNRLLKTMIYAFICSILVLKNGEQLRELFYFAMQYYPVVS